MTVKDLKDKLSSIDDNAIVGFEHLQITYLLEEDDSYVDLGGNGTSNRQDVVYILYATSVKQNTHDAEPPIITRDVFAVCSSYRKAEEKGKWLLSLQEFDNKKYYKYEIKPIFVL